MDYNTTTVNSSKKMHSAAEFYSDFYNTYLLRNVNMKESREICQRYISNIVNW